MAYQDTMTAAEVLSAEITATRRVLGRIGRFFASIGESISLAAIARQRFETVQMLQSKSDAELARLNIKREEIVHHVFKDVYYT